MNESLKTKEHFAYIEHQKQKTTNPEKIKKWLGEEWSLKLNGFKEIFSQYEGVFNKNKKCVGLGARTGQEIAALKELGYKDSIGIDLVAFEPYTIKGDFHKLPFDNSSVSLIYSNAVDHVLNPKLWSQEINRVLSKGGHILFNLQINIGQDEYSVFEIEDVESDLIDKYFNDYKIIKNNSIPQNIHAMNWETLIQK